MHEHALMQDLIREIESTARAEGAGRVTRIRVRLGALSHFTPEQFEEHFADASRGTLAEGAAVETELRTDPTEPEAQGVVLESIDVEPSFEETRETGDTMVVTVPVSCANGDELEVTTVEHEVMISGPDGFRHELRLPLEADMSRLRASLYMGFLELRAPRVEPPLPHAVPVRTLSPAG